jgi:quercetin dioxygenase-like cupin family protein
MQTAIKNHMNAIVHAADEPTFAVVGTLLQFVSPPERTAGHAVVMRGGIPPRAAIPLHNHESPEIFYILEGTMEVFQDDGESSGWQTAGVGDVVTIAGGVKHALRNPGDTTVMTVLVAEEQLFRFLRELAEPLATGDVPPVPTPEVMRRLFEVAARYRYWIGSPEENAAIGLLLG